MMQSSLFSYHESGEGDDRMTLDMFLKIARIDGESSDAKRTKAKLDVLS